LFTGKKHVFPKESPLRASGSFAVYNMTQYKREMFKDAPAYIHANARHLRQNLTHAELVLWTRLKDKPNGFKFRRQHPIATYIVDFYCHAGKLVVEVDGPIHAEETNANNDLQKDEELKKMGLTVLRFSNGDILNDVEDVVIAILQHLENQKEISTL
jgi:very-short-patch-repair endonuclease